MNEEISFTKKARTGVHRFRLKGQWISVKPGASVVCPPEALGSAIDEYTSPVAKKRKRAEKEEKATPTPLFSLKRRGSSGYYDIVSSVTKKPVNTKGLRKKQAEETLEDMLKHQAGKAAGGEDEE